MHVQHRLSLCRLCAHPSAGRLSHARALLDGRPNHSTVAETMAVGAEPWLERRRLVLQPIQPSPAHRSTRHHPYLALAHSSPHDSYIYRLWSDTSSRRAAALSARWWPGGRSRSTGLASQLGRSMERKYLGRGGVVGPLRRRARSFCTCGAREGWSPYLVWTVLGPSD